MITKKQYEAAVAVAVTLIAVFGFLWFSGVEEKAVEASLPGSLEELGVR
ncbi:MAG TPA: hypothetical protein VJG29_02390 [Candidatus Paceibacterota bacterium]